MDLQPIACGTPDVGDARLAATSLEQIARDLGGDLEDARMVREAHLRRARYENEKWPADCHPALTRKYGPGTAVKVFIDWSTFPRHNLRPCTEQEMQGLHRAGVWGYRSTQEAWEQWRDVPMAKVALHFALEAYRKLGCHHEEVFDGREGGDHQIHIRAKHIPGSTIGVGWFPNGTCGDHVHQHIDVIPFGLHGLARLFAHELGHNHGEEHEFRNQGSHMSVMSYTPPRDGLFYGFSTGKPPFPDWLPMDRSLPSLREKYGGSYYPVSLDDSPDEPDPEPPEEPEVDGIIQKLVEWLVDGLLKRCVDENGKARALASAKRRSDRHLKLAKRRAMKEARKEKGKKWARKHQDAIEARVESEWEDLTDAELEAWVDSVGDEADE